MSLIWLDLETSDLRADRGSVLEVAAIATTDDLTEIARIQRVVYFPKAAEIVDRLALSKSYTSIGADFGDIHPKVVEMHDVNRLWEDCVNGLALDTVDRDLAEFSEYYGYQTLWKTDPSGLQGSYLDKPQLAGSTISFDRGFIEAHLPRFEKTLHYRNVDVSTLNETARRFWPDLYAARPNDKEKAHRGMNDIEESIRVYKHYLERLKPRHMCDRVFEIALSIAKNHRDGLNLDDLLAELSRETQS